MPRPYQKYEFCRATKCRLLEDGKCVTGVFTSACERTAKEFHQWLQDQGFEILKVGICPECGQNREDGMNFCAFCGRDLSVGGHSSMEDQAC